jgi:hypothetical protein
MARRQELAPRRRARRLWLGLTGALLLLVLVGFGWCWFVLTPLLDERRPFVGTWRLEWPVFPARPELVVEIDIMLDGTMRDRVWDPHTGVVDHEQLRPGRWWVSNGRFQEVMGANPLFSRLGAGGRGTLGWDHPVAWEGPDRFRLQGTSASRRTMIWSRCHRSGCR